MKTTKTVNELSKTELIIQLAKILFGIIALYLLWRIEQSVV